MSKRAYSSLRVGFPLIVALVVLIFIGWGLGLLAIYPCYGIETMNRNGLIDAVDAAVTESSPLQDRDIFVSVDGIPTVNSQPFYSTRRAGDQIRFLVLRNGRSIRLTVTTVEPDSGKLFARITPLLVALIYWIVGASVLYIKSQHQESSFYHPLACLQG